MEQNYSDIKRLAELRDKGLLTEEEFQQKKQKILGTQQHIPSAPKKKGPGCLKGLLITFLAIFVFGTISSIVVFFNDFDIDEVSETQQPVVKEEISNDSVIVILDNAIKTIKEDKDVYKGNSSGVTMYLTMFEAFGQVYNSYKDNPDEKVKVKLSEFQKAAGNYQEKMLPKMRETYYKDLKRKLWRSNIEVSQPSSTTLQLTGASLANNANKEDMMNAMSEIVNKLRFQRINMKWYKYDDEYTYYSLKNPKDRELY